MDFSWAVIYTVFMANEDKFLTVSQLNALIKNMLEGSFPSIQLKGEISNFKSNSSGHLYFALKDSDSQISGVMFRGRASTLNFKPKDGMLVLVTGSVSVYPPQGRYQIIVTSMVQAGLGAIMEMLEERKKKLAAEGLFDSSRKKVLPFFPGTVGVVTSPTGAALRDILQIIQRRNSKVSVVVLPAMVQGEGASSTIERMINLANEYNLCDVLIVGRGGGSLEDLLPFSDENVVRAIADSNIPTISAVGHQIDWALSDFAADVRAPTPSAAAELAVPVQQDIDVHIQNMKNELFNSMQQKIQNLRMLLKTFTPENMELQLRHIEQPLLNRYENARSGLEENIRQFIQEKRQRIQNCVTVLESCNPQTIFNRGYSMVRDAVTGKVIRSPKDTEIGHSILITPANGTIQATVTEYKE